MYRDYEEEAFLFAKVANICREEIFNKQVKFPGYFSSDCQDQYNVPRSNQILKDDLDHNPSSTAANCSIHETSSSIIKRPTNENPGIYGTQSEFDMVQTKITHSLSGSYVPVMSMKAVNISVQQIRTGLGTGQYISFATYHVTMQSEQINPLASRPMHYPCT